MTLTSNPEFTIYDELGQDGSLIRIAGTTCYRSEETTKLDADGFVRMLKKNNHTAMLEFSWFPVAVSIDGGELLYTTFLSSHKFFEYSVINGVAYISGNGRAWYNYLKDRKYMVSKITTISIIAEKIAALLKEINPVLFDFTIDEHLIASDKFNRVKVSNASMDVLEIKELHDKHRWFMVKYFNVSRGFTHETVRHRVMSFAQASTRYIKNENFEYIAFPPDTQISDEIMKKYIAWVEHTKEMYSMLKSNGFKNDIARQVLPIGIANEICVAGTLEKWKGVFELRTKSDAHWEIRNIMSSTELAIKELI